MRLASLTLTTFLFQLVSNFAYFVYKNVKVLFNTSLVIVLSYILIVCPLTGIEQAFVDYKLIESTPLWNFFKASVSLLFSLCDIALIDGSLELSLIIYALLLLFVTSSLITFVLVFNNGIVCTLVFNLFSLVSA